MIYALPSLLLNLVIVALCAAVCLVTGNPLGMLGLTFLRDMQMLVAEEEEKELEDADGTQIGFVKD